MNRQPRRWAYTVPAVVIGFLIGWLGGRLAGLASGHAYFLLTLVTTMVSVRVADQAWSRRKAALGTTGQRRAQGRP